MGTLEPTPQAVWHPEEAWLPAQPCFLLSRILGISSPLRVHLLKRRKTT